MRVLLAAATFAACLAAGQVLRASDVPAQYEISAPKQAARVKPPRTGANDTCRWANDMECDEPGIGTGACTANTDVSDCRYLRQGESDACRWARDGECDEPAFGTGSCVQGSDRTDCGDVAWLRFQNDSCATAFNDVCEEPGHGSGSCAARTDRSDCRGRQRPMSITDHFFGHDDRVLMDPTQFPWSIVGQFHRDGSGGACTATLIADDVLVTAAHCISSDNGTDARGRFVTAVGRAGGPFEARIVAYHIHPRFNYRRFTSGDDIDGLDWALLRIDRPLGRELGHAGVQNLTGQGRAALSAPLHQAGYAWDTGEHLSGNIGCHMVRVYDDNTFAHECDTTRGDSGSALLVRNGAGYDVIGVDSNFRSNPNGPFIYIAVSAAGFQPYVADFIAGRSGTPVNGGARGKPPARGTPRTR
jgi:protease YdgD